MLIIIAGHIDLSIGSVVALSGAIAAVSMVDCTSLGCPPCSSRWSRER
ncbi:hypothetical protein [Solihabitans fulvus]|nr:hypothetical protein [Solihabitans fulvus]